VDVCGELAECLKVGGQGISCLRVERRKRGIKMIECGKGLLERSGVGHGLLVGHEVERAGSASKLVFVCRQTGDVNLR
jgi:hypothetical protein